MITKEDGKDFSRDEARNIIRPENHNVEKKQEKIEYINISKFKLKLN